MTHGDETVVRVVGTPSYEVHPVAGTNYLPRLYLYRMFLRAARGTLLMVVGYDCRERYPIHTAFPYNVEIYEVGGEGSFNPEKMLRGRGVRTEREVCEGVLAYAHDLTQGNLRVRGEGDRVWLFRSLSS